MVGGLKKGGGAGGKVTTQNLSILILYFLYISPFQSHFQPYPPGQLPRPNSLNDFNEVEEEVKVVSHDQSENTNVVYHLKYHSMFRGGILVK